MYDVICLFKILTMGLCVFPYLQHFAVAHDVARMQDFMPLHHQRQRAFQRISVELAAQVQAGGHTLIGPCLPLGILLQL